MEGNERYIVSARKYRPGTFGSVVGQEALTSTLRNAIDTGRLAQAYLFCGPRGVGKTSCARIFAKTINCLHPTADGEACGECESCRAIDRGNSFNIIELDAASNNSVDDIRNLTDQVNVPPTVGKYRVFIIDEVHMLSSAAFNAFLKTLEEPPKYVIFILATTEKHKVIPTILSRCQIYDFKRITVGDITSHLSRVASAEGIAAEESALGVIARKADGAMRDALSIFDQVAASSRGNITYASTVASLNVLDYDYYFRLVDAFRAHDVQGALLLYKDIREQGFDSLFFINGLAGHIRDLMVAYTPQTAVLLEVSGDIAEAYTKQARSLSVEWYYAALGLLNDCDLNYRTVSDKRLHVELCLIRLCRLGMAEMAPQTGVPTSGQPQAPAAPQAPATPRQPQAAPQQPVRQQPQQQPQQPVQQQPQRPPLQPARPQQPQRQPIQPRTQGVHQPGNTIRLAPAPGRPAAPQQPQQPQQPATPRQPQAAPQQPGPQAPTTARFTEDDLRRHWEGYIASHSDRHLIVSAMRKTLPRPSQDGSYYAMMVDHPGIEMEVSRVLPELTDYLRKGLGDDSFTLRTVVMAPGERPKVLSPREALARAVKKNHTLSNLLQQLEVEII